jgi:ElaB/YqjD/DUF883 family membrane-anchored ribosome-binding protein
LKGKVKTMADETRAAQTSKLEDDLKSVRADLDKLRSDLRTDFDAVSKDLGDPARNATSMAAERGRHALEAVEQRVEESPLPSTAVAFGIGFLAGFLLSRR